MNPILIELAGVADLGLGFYPKEKSYNGTVPASPVIEDNKLPAKKAPITPKEDIQEPQVS